MKLASKRVICRGWRDFEGCGGFERVLRSVNVCAAMVLLALNAK